MGFFRSEPMSLCQILLHNESAFDCLVELGIVGNVQLRNIYDESAVCNNRYNMDIQRCNELNRMINYLENEMIQINIKPVFYPKIDEEEILKATDMKLAEDFLEEFYNKVSDINGNIDDLRRRRNLLYEKEQVLMKANEFLTGEQHTESVYAWSDSVVMDLMHDDTVITDKESLQMGFLTGTIETKRYGAFERMVYRITRGNYYLRYVDVSFIQNDQTWMEKQNYKYVFMLFFVGQYLREKLTKVCQGFGIRLFECPETKEDRKYMTRQVKQDIVDLNRIIVETEKQRHYLLVLTAADIYIWKVKVKKALMVYFVMNHMTRVKRLQVERYLQTECWIPTSELRNVRNALTRGVERTAKSVNMFPAMVIELNRKQVNDEEKPTLFRLNRLTRGFQNLIDAYGVATYRELNPAPYTIITFPFLFAVMFGDVGHGLLMALFGLFMIVKEKHYEEAKRQEVQSSEIWSIMFAGRYIIFLMGVFSIYTGLIYNDVFSKSVNIFGSRWLPNKNATADVGKLHEYQLDPIVHFRDNPYWFGMDPVWDAAGENSITTHNSIKMKIAVILGVSQMMFGLLLAATNYLLKKEYSEFFLVFIPQITFLSCIFCYLVFMIFFKWVHYGGNLASPYNSACAPSILIIFINMLLMKKEEIPPEGCLVWMYSSQHIVQQILLYTALISVPILVAGRPFFIMYQRKKLRKLKTEEGRLSKKQSTASSIRRTLVYNVESTSTLRFSKPDKQEQPEKQDMIEVWIHSGIHCIESVLGSVSHTASYLRLWALSLAHDQLSTVLWDMVLDVGLCSSQGYWGALIICAVFYFWAALTVAILVVMEGLSAFLHTLRLHWVEFQSKFYAGAGVKFTPFVFPDSTVRG